MVIGRNAVMWSCVSSSLCFILFLHFLCSFDETLRHKGVMFQGRKSISTIHSTLSSEHEWWRVDTKGLALNNQDSNEEKDKNVMVTSTQRASEEVRVRLQLLFAWRAFSSVPCRSMKFPRAEFIALDESSRAEFICPAAISAQMIAPSLRSESPL